jgi:hypothetical protein
MRFVRSDTTNAYRWATCRLTGSIGHATAALHSRVIEKSIAAANTAKTKMRLCIPNYDARDQTDCANLLVILIFSSPTTRIDKVPVASATVNFASKC